MLEQDLLDFVRTRSHAQKLPVDADTLLFSDGILDSLAVFEMTAFVEQRAGVKFASADINLDNLDSVRRVLRYVNSKHEGKQ
jgi:acyl carrier protein